MSLANIAFMFVSSFILCFFTILVWEEFPTKKIPKLFWFVQLGIMVDNQLPGFLSGGDIIRSTCLEVVILFCSLIYLFNSLGKSLKDDIEPTKNNHSVSMDKGLFNAIRNRENNKALMNNPLSRKVKPAKIVNIGAEFSKFPGGRFLSDGPFSGEAFCMKYTQVIRENDEVIFQLDDTAGYSSAFLEEAFGGLVCDGKNKCLGIT